mmetsp:Transcript_86404/g.230824  ORF Transcript_86404/g.230824 Transcript_86404/m.230824 type:complete len:208 (+) Transcript_86404:793-1416(+)
MGHQPVRCQLQRRHQQLRVPAAAGRHHCPRHLLLLQYARVLCRRPPHPPRRRLPPVALGAHPRHPPHRRHALPRREHPPGRAPRDLPAGPGGPRQRQPAPRVGQLPPTAARRARGCGGGPQSEQVPGLRTGFVDQAVGVRHLAQPGGEVAPGALYRHHAALQLLAGHLHLPAPARRHGAGTHGRGRGVPGRGAFHRRHLPLLARQCL